jgi:Tn3 transposase DDE domain
VTPFAWLKAVPVASGLNRAIAAIVHWNSTYLADAIDHIRANGTPVPPEWLAHTSPLTCEHIGFSGDSLWDRAAATAGQRRSQFRARKQGSMIAPQMFPKRSPRASFS